LKGRLQTAHEIVRQKLINHKIKSKDVEPVTYEVGQKVLLHDETVEADQGNSAHNILGLTKLLL